MAWFRRSKERKNAANILERVRRVRGQVKFLKISDLVELRKVNESLARELVARTVVLPEAKALLGKNLNAVVIIGSAQLGVRESILGARKRGSDYRESDLDIMVLSPEGFSEKMMLEEGNRSDMDRVVGLFLDRLSGSQRRVNLIEKQTALEKAARKHGLKRIGFRLNLNIVEPALFKKFLTNSEFSRAHGVRGYGPFQVISGKAFVESLFGKEYLAEMRKARKEKKSSYSGTHV
ncbi:MAG: hypothetical protein WC308_01505 [archaeon]